MRSFVVAVTICCLAVANGESPFTFLTIGDWGGAFIGTENPAEAQYLTNVNAVASQMANISTLTNAKFIVNTGDNFYWCGIQNTSDPQIEVDFVKPYSAESLQIRWYGSLGNHEYGYNVEAQIEYTKMSKNWYLPARYYYERIPMNSNHHLSLIVLDTSPCVSGYRSDDQSKWDPCMTKYPTCSIFNTDDDFEGPCLFHENILQQSCSAQYNWLQSTLQGVPKNDWLVVVGHHPLDEVDVYDFATLIQQHGFSLYLNGHTHLMNQYTLNGGGAYVTSGAGSMVQTADQSHELTALKLNGEAVPTSALGQSYKTICTNKVAGFTAHSFNADFTELTTTFYDNLSNVVNQFTSDRSGVWTAEAGACKS